MQGDVVEVEELADGVTITIPPAVVVNTEGYGAASYATNNEFKVAIWDGENWTPSTVSESKIFSSSISMTETREIFAAWRELEQATFVLYSAIYQNDSWGAPVKIYTGVRSFPLVRAKSDKNALLVFLDDNRLLSHTWDGTQWSEDPQIIETYSQPSSLSLTMNLKGEATATWIELSTATNQWQIFAMNGRFPDSPTPGGSGSGIQETVTFPMQSTVTNFLSWPLFKGSVQHLKVYRDGSLIATLPAGGVSFADYKRVLGKTYFYQIKAEDSHGDVIKIVNITVN